MTETPGLLGASEIRRLATELGVRPTKKLGQNFVHDANTVRRIVRESRITADDVVVEIGPGLGSLTLALLGVADCVVAIEVDERLAARLPADALRGPGLAGAVLPSDGIRFEVAVMVEAGRGARSIRSGLVALDDLVEADPLVDALQLVEVGLRQRERRRGAQRSPVVAVEGQVRRQALHGAGP